MQEALSPGSRVGRYRVEQVVARGGMGVVYRAFDVGLERAVALKVIAPEVAAEPGFRERFILVDPGEATDRTRFLSAFAVRPANCIWRRSDPMLPRDKPSQSDIHRGLCGFRPA